MKKITIIVIMAFVALALVYGQGFGLGDLGGLGGIGGMGLDPATVKAMQKSEIANVGSDQNVVIAR